MYAPNRVGGSRLLMKERTMSLGEAITHKKRENSTSEAAEDKRES